MTERMHETERIKDSGNQRQRDWTKEGQRTTAEANN